MREDIRDLVQANRDAILSIYEEGVWRLQIECAYLATSLMQSPAPPPIVVRDLQEHARLALAIIDAIQAFHPMHGESWRGWPLVAREEG